MPSSSSNSKTETQGDTLNDQIISTDEIKRNARDAFKAGKTVADCPFQSDTEAANKWCTEMHMLHLETDDELV